MEKELIPGRPLLFIVEDIHGEVEAQKNIRGILEMLKRQLEARSSKLEAKAKTEEVFTSSLEPRASNQVLASNRFYVFLEGAAGPLDYSFFTGFPGHEVMEKVQKEHLEKGEISGGESFLMTEDNRHVGGFGVEEVSDYVENLKLMGKFLEERELEENALEDMEVFLKNLRHKTYSKELMELVEEREQYGENKIEMGEYLYQISNIKYQNDKSKIKNDQPVIASEAKQSQFFQYPAIQKFLKFQFLQKKTDLKAVESEYLKFLSELEKKLPKEAMAEVMRHVLEHRLGRMSDEEHYLYLRRYLE
ncbi:MAG: hypothetical protein HYS07_01350, partial [Chlamydiae bacterium]|nr:hypothetical protein [Chlamydiota bacterium]